jgi:hypothetical protein
MATSYVCQLIWTWLLDYGKIAWTKTLKWVPQVPTSIKKLVRKFDLKWGRFHRLCTRQKMVVTWCATVHWLGLDRVVRSLAAFPAGVVFVPWFFYAIWPCVSFVPKIIIIIIIIINRKLLLPKNFCIFYTLGLQNLGRHGRFFIWILKASFILANHQQINTIF